MVSAIVIAAVASGEPPAALPYIRPYEKPARKLATNPIDSFIDAALQTHKITPAMGSSDEVFVRRVYLDITGTLPDAAAVRRFLSQAQPTKRAELIDELLASEAFVAYSTLKWCDVLRVKAEFPINLWPNAVQAYHRWIYNAVRSNLPYDQFARELLTASGSNFRVPPVNFYRAIQERTPAGTAAAVALTFMGVRWESLSSSQRQQMAAFFSRIAYKPTAEWKEEIILLDPTAVGSLEAVFPDGTNVVIAAGQDPRRVFADWLIRPDNPWFSRQIVNRIWARLMGYGLIHEPDDIRADNPPSHPELLAYLEKELVKADFDLKAIYRLILNSRTYQQSSIPRSSDPQAERLFACYPVRRLDAEVLIDAVCRISQTRESYSSAIPEPFTFIPEQQPTIALADGSISSPFLEMFGRPSRDTGLESERSNQSTEAQRLHLLNSSHIQKKIETSPYLSGLIRSAKKNPEFLVKTIYLTILSRYPTPEELQAAQSYLTAPGLGIERAANDVIWALMNTKEFLYRH